MFKWEYCLRNVKFKSAVFICCWYTLKRQHLFWVPKFKKNLDQLERVQKREMQVISLKKQLHKDGRKSELFWQEMRGLNGM